MVEPDLVRPGEGTPRVVEPVDHPGIDVLRRADALAQRERALVDRLADDPAKDQAGDVANPLGELAERGEELLRGGHRGRRRVLSARELDQPGAGERREDMEADRAAAGVEGCERAGRTADRLRAALQRRLGLL